MGKIATAVGRSDVHFMKPESLVLITAKNHPLYDPRVEGEPEEKLILSLMAHGNKLQVVDGRQRVKAALAANRRLTAEGKEPLNLKVLIERGDDKDMYGISILSNEIRKDDDLFVKAEKLKRYLNMGHTVEEASVVFGVTGVTITTWQSLLDLAPGLRRAVASGAVSATAAAKLAKLPRDEQEGAAEAAMTRGEKLSGRKANAVANRGSTISARPTIKQMKTALQHPKLSGARKETLAWVLGCASDEIVAMFAKTISEAQMAQESL